MKGGNDLADRVLEKGKMFRQRGGSMYIAIKNVLGALDVNTEDQYEVEYYKDKIVIKKVK